MTVGLPDRLLKLGAFSLTLTICFDFFIAHFISLLLFLLLSDGKVVASALVWAKMHLAHAFLYLLVLRQVLRLTKAVQRALACGHCSTWDLLIHDAAIRLVLLLWLSLEVLKGCRDVILTHNALDLAHEVSVKLMSIETLFLRRATIIDTDLLVTVVELPRLTLILLVEVHNEERVLEVDEEVSHVGHLLRLLLISDDVECRIPVLLCPIDLILELFLRVAARNILDTQVGSKVLTQLDQIDLDRLVVPASVRLRGWARILRSRCTLGVVAGLLVWVWRVRVSEVVRELILAVVRAQHIGSTNISWPRDLLRSRRLHVVNAKTAASDRKV